LSLDEEIFLCFSFLHFDDKTSSFKRKLLLMTLTLTGAPAAAAGKGAAPAAPGAASSKASSPAAPAAAPAKEKSPEEKKKDLEAQIKSLKVCLTFLIVIIMSKNVGFFSFSKCETQMNE